MSPYPIQLAPRRRSQIRRRAVGRRCIVAFAGELDVTTAPELERTLAAAIDDGAAQVWVDLGETTFMDAAGVHALLRAHGELTRLNRGFALLRAGGPVARVLEISRVPERIPTYASRTAAHRAA